ncbi:hypothetical protein RZS08_35865, partial [Arthrospira platensis SPKY1]|nr:hypothetical protein [Arthrospira platensis SPKY1]
MLVQLQGKDFTIAFFANLSDMSNKDTLLINDIRNLLAIRRQTGEIGIFQRQAERDVIVGAAPDLIGHRACGHRRVG